MKQLEMNAVRELAYEELTQFKFGDFIYEGRVHDGIVFSDGNSNFVVAKFIVKRDSYADEVYTLMEDYVMKNQSK